MTAPLEIAFTPGDGIGPEIMQATLDLFREAGALEHVALTEVEMGASVFARGDTRGMTDDAIAGVERAGILFKGPMETPKGGGGKSINVTARKMWGAFANLRHFRSLPGVETVYSRAGVPIDLYIVRENIEDTYGGIEHRLTPDVVECKRLITAPGSDQVHHFAFRTARRLGIERIHCGHKANIMKLTDGLFLDRFREVARVHPEITADDVIIDALCMDLVQRPRAFRMVVLPNLQGDIVSDLAAGLVGGLGFAPSANIGEHVSIFEAVHGTAPDIAGKGIANPTALILSGLMMLRHVGLMRSAAVIENALLATLECGCRTGDFGDSSTPPLSTREYTRAIIDRLGEAPSRHRPVPVPDADAPTHERPPRPESNRLMLTFPDAVKEFVGCDVYVESRLAIEPLAESLRGLAAGSPFHLTMISNRGTQVWPAASVYTDLVDYWRVRFELSPGREPGSAGQKDALDLLARIGEVYDITDFQPLRNYDGQRGYSLAQGQ